MRYEISLFTWYGVDVWTAEFENHDELFKWYKNTKHLIEDDCCSKDYVYKTIIKCFIK